MTIENQSLFDKKKSLISSDLLLEKVTEGSFLTLSCRYHNIPFHFHSCSSSFLESLSLLIPASWNSDVGDSLPIYFMSPDLFNFSENEWCDEESQDCFFDFNTKVAVQRDFVAKEFSDKIIVIAFEDVSDGYHNFMRWFLPRQLLKISNYVLHSSCLLDSKERAHYFLGHSGAGKTTITKMRQDQKVLGDDMNILSVLKNKIQASAGAIGGTVKPDVCYDSSFEVGSFNWIKQSPLNKRSLLGPEQASVKLLASISNIFWENLTSDEIEKIMLDVNFIVNNYSFYELEFTKTPELWKLIDAS